MRHFDFTTSEQVSATRGEFQTRLENAEKRPLKPVKAPVKPPRADIQLTKSDYSHAGGYTPSLTHTRPFYTHPNGRACPNQFFSI